MKGGGGRGCNINARNIGISMVCFGLLHDHCMGEQMMKFGLENGTNLESTSNPFLFDLVWIQRALHSLRVDRSFIYKECCRLYFVFLCCKPLFFIFFGSVSFTSVQRFVLFVTFKCVELMQSTRRTHKRTYKHWKLHSICLWIMMNILCDTFDENESFNKFK